MRNLLLIIAIALGVYALSQSDKNTVPAVVDTKPIVTIQQPEPIGSDEPIIEDEPQAEPEIEPAPAPPHRTKQRVWVRSGLFGRRGHWEWR